MEFHGGFLMQNNSHGESCGCIIIIDFRLRQCPPVTEVKHIACRQNGEFDAPLRCLFAASATVFLEDNVV